MKIFTDLDMQNNRIKNIGAPVNDYDLITKAYLEDRLNAAGQLNYAANTYTSNLSNSDPAIIPRERDGKVWVNILKHLDGTANFTSEVDFINSNYSVSGNGRLENGYFLMDYTTTTLAPEDCDYVIDATNGDDTNDGTPQAPWASLSPLLELLKNNADVLTDKTIYIKGGLYNITANDDNTIYTAYGHIVIPVSTNFTIYGDPNNEVTINIDASGITDRAYIFYPYPYNSSSSVPKHLKMYNLYFKITYGGNLSSNYQTPIFVAHYSTTLNLEAYGCRFVNRNGYGFCYTYQGTLNLTLSHSSVYAESQTIDIYNSDGSISITIPEGSLSEFVNVNLTGASINGNYNNITSSQSADDYYTQNNWFNQNRDPLATFQYSQGNAEAEPLYAIAYKVGSNSISSINIYFDLPSQSSGYFQIFVATSPENLRDATQRTILFFNGTDWVTTTGEDKVQITGDSPFSLAEFDKFINYLNTYGSNNGVDTVYYAFKFFIENNTTDTTPKLDYVRIINVDNIQGELLPTDKYTVQVLSKHIKVEYLGTDNITADINIFEY